MNCGIYATLLALKDLGVEADEVRFKKVLEKEGTSHFWLNENILPPGFFLRGPAEPSMLILERRMAMGHKVLGRVPGEDGEAHMVYITHISEGVPIARDNLHEKEFPVNISEFSSLYFVYKLYLNT